MSQGRVLFAELLLACLERGGALLERGLARGKRLGGSRPIAVVCRSLAPETKDATSCSLRIAFALVDLGPRAFDLELACCNFGCALAQRAL